MTAQINVGSMWGFQLKLCLLVCIKKERGKRHAEANNENQHFFIV